MDPIVKQNSDNICKVKSDIQNEFDRFISSLTRQKNELFSKLDELEVEKLETLQLNNLGFFTQQLIQNYTFFKVINLEHSA